MDFFKLGLSDYYTVWVYVQSLKSQFRQKFVEIKYIFGFHLPTKHKNVYDKIANLF